MHRRSKALDMDQRRALVAELYLKGKTQWDIARQAKVNQATISRDIKALHELWRGSAVRDFDLCVQRELEKIDLLERTYWVAWDKSCKAATKTRKKRTVVEEENAKPRTSGPVEVTDEREGRDGNPAYLAGVQWCINRRCELLSLDPDRPKRVLHGGDPKSPPITVNSQIEVDLAKLSVDELRTLRDLRAKMVGAGESRNGHHPDPSAL